MYHFSKSEITKEAVSDTLPMRFFTAISKKSKGAERLMRRGGNGGFWRCVNLDRADV